MGSIFVLLSVHKNQTLLLLLRMKMHKKLRYVDVKKNKKIIAKDRGLVGGRLTHCDRSLLLTP